MLLVYFSKNALMDMLKWLNIWGIGTIQIILFSNNTFKLFLYVILFSVTLIFHVLWDKVRMCILGIVIS